MGLAPREDRESQIVPVGDPKTTGELDALREQSPQRAGVNGADERERVDTQDSSIPLPKRRSGPIGRFAFRLVLVALAIGLAIAGYRTWQYMDTYVTTDDAQIDGHIAPISSRISGTIARVYVQDTQFVAAGTALAEIDPRDAQASVDNARANLAEVEAQVESARAGQISAEAKVRQAAATNDQAQKDAERYTSLYKQRVVSGAEYDERIRAAAVDQAALESELATANAAKKIIGSRQASVKAARAALDQALLNHEYTKIVAPMSGVVGKKTVEVGQRVQPGQLLLAIVPLDDIWITANFKETQIRKLRPGQRVTIYVDSTDRDYDGYVEGLGGASGEKYSLLPPENATGNYVKVVQRLPIRIRLNSGQNGDRRLRPGMSVDATVWLR
ncbi:MAG: HlyD family secretion protein [Candidatus Binatus sp.]|uniref:HlyD family secretion protein n=1 Tax=Candidatus Binatus sp. TaxID=2811406 RepID=UPI00272751B2|nr:HlyD family secretion protein [Candidatus Binatus sp.]MDO8434068.1 HlyD family secretion protein [Candidatus Binatus sp.]